MAPSAARDSGTSSTSWIPVSGATATRPSSPGPPSARRESVDPDLPIVAWIHEDNAPSQGVARRLGLTDYGLLGAAHWNGEPMHYWADREPGARLR